jgi:hypothetical protein
VGGYLVTVDGASNFARTHYYDQMQWQMFVLNAERCLFVWEQHDGILDPHGDGRTYMVSREPQFCWIPRNEDRIAFLITRADEALEAIDRHRATGGIPPVSDVDVEVAMLVTDYLEALEAESMAKARKEKAYLSLKGRYLTDTQPDDSLDLGFARITVTTSNPRPKRVVDEAKARATAPALAQKWDDLIARHTTEVTPVGSRSITVTRKAQA